MELQKLCLALVAGGLVLSLPSSAWAQGPSPVVVTPAIEEQIVGRRSFIGTVMPRRTSVVGSAVDGRVEEFLVTQGDWVQKGDVLAKLRTATIDLEIAAARADLQYRQFMLSELENGTRPEEVLQAKAERDGAQALRDYARSRFQRTQSLFQQGRAMSQNDLDEAQSAAIAAEQTFLAAQAAYDLKVQGPRTEQIEQARAQRLAQEELVRQLEDQREKYTIVAPFDGYVVAEHTEVGAWIKSGDLVAEVIELDPAEVHLNVPEKFIPEVEEGMRVEVQAEALPERVFEGQVKRVVPKADLRSRTFPVIIELPNPRENNRHVLKSGMLTSVTLISTGDAASILVPKDALVLSGASAQVVVIDANSIQRPPDGPPNMRIGTVTALPVEQGAASGSLMEVRAPNGALKAGTLVVTRGNERLRTGQPVSFIDPSGSAAAEKR